MVNVFASQLFSIHFHIDSPKYIDNEYNLKSIKLDIIVNKILPKEIKNIYQGHPIAFWGFIAFSFNDMAFYCPSRLPRVWFASDC